MDASFMEAVRSCSKPLGCSIWKRDVCEIFQQIPEAMSRSGGYSVEAFCLLLESVDIDGHGYCIKDYTMGFHPSKRSLKILAGNVRAKCQGLCLRCVREQVQSPDLCMEDH